MIINDINLTGASTELQAFFTSLQTINTNRLEDDVREPLNMKVPKNLKEEFLGLELDEEELEEAFPCVRLLILVETSDEYTKICALYSTSMLIFSDELEDSFKTSGIFIDRTPI